MQLRVSDWFRRTLLRMRPDSTSPDYSTGYNGYRALLSSRYIERFYIRHANSSPSLSKLDKRLILKLAQNDIDHTKKRKAIGLFLILVLIVYLRVALAANASSPVPEYTLVFVGLTLIAIEQFTFRLLRRSRHEHAVADKLFFAVLMLERNEVFWGTTKFRWEFAAELEVIAKRLERIPLSLKKVAPAIKRDAFRTSEAKAQGLRQLELLAIKPREDTFSELIEQLTSNLSLVIEGQWFELPEGDYKQRSRTWLIIFQIGAATLVVVAAIIILGLASKIGPTASISATILIAVAVAILNTAGVPTALVERYAQAGVTVVPRK